MITDERLKELMASVGMPDSKSLYQALKQCDMEAELRGSEELETLRASNTNKQANIELLEAENAKLIADQSVNLNSLAKSFGDEFIVDPEYYYISKAIEHLIKDRLAMQAEREAMMKQEPVEYQQFIRLNFNWQRITKEKYEQLEKEGDAVIRKLFSDPLPAQQIEQKLGSWHTYLPIITDEIVNILGTEPVVLIEKDESTISGYTWTQDAVDFCCIIQVNEPAQQYSKAFSDGFKAGKEGDEDLEDITPS